MLKPSVFDKYRAAVEVELHASLATGSLPLYDMLRYHLGWTDVQGRPAKQTGGKFLRPTLCLSSCMATGGDAEKALPSAAAVELVHNFSLIHDDVQDVSDYRRHQLAVWKVWGVAQAITAGDSMYAFAHLEILQLSRRGVPAHRVLASSEALGQACRYLCEGQYLDVLFEGKQDVSVDEYLQMITDKTAALMGTATRLGAIAATDDKSTIECLSRFGHHLGIAFQVHDDVLGIWQSFGKTGKPQFNDILRRKKTLPVILGLTDSNASVSDALSRLYAKQDITQADAKEIAHLLESIGARERSLNMLKQHRQLAANELAAMPNSAGANELMEIMDFVLSADC
ncbi:MAG: polyprenyl synthetase family protein [Dehalococcoidia bacterium]|nr:polyprenyl synthetase family protein [Dehalococcoidia bacterium]